MRSFYVGNYTKCGVNLLDKNLCLLYSSNDFCNPSYLCQNKDMLYCITETFPAYLVCYCNIGASLEKICSIEIGLDGPCFLTVDPVHSILYVACYAIGSLLAFRLNDDGSIGEKLYYKCFGKSSHIHHICFSQDYNFLFVTDLGKDELLAYQIVDKHSNIVFHKINAFSFPAGTQPRHIVMGNNNNLYVITELSCKLYHIRFLNNHTFELVGFSSLLPSNTTILENFTGCAIKMSFHKDFIYTSIRGHNSISIFTLKNSIPTLIQTISCNGNNPRDIEICFNGTLLLCANYLSNSITYFTIDSKTGLLTYNGTSSLSSPSCILEYTYEKNITN